MRQTRLVLAGALVVALALPASVGAAGPAPQRPLPQSLVDQKIDGGVRATDGVRPVVLAEGLRAASGPQQVVIRLKGVPAGALSGATKQKVQHARLGAQQEAFIGRARGVDASFRVLGQTQVALNAVIARVEAKALARLARDSAVESIRPVVDYQLDLSETVPYIGGSAVQKLGVTGKGITVAVLDSGIDYTHAAFGGPGTDLAYKNAYGTKLKHTKNQKINDAYKGVKLYPTKKVVGGYDFVGELWVGGAGSPPLAPDPDPIPCGPGAIEETCDGSHGTHVADIIAGAKGVAPDASLMAVKVCSSISTSCSGVALIQGMDFAIDPNGDGSTADRVDIINMSLGSPYGPSTDDDLSAAVETASAAGTLVVTSSGNSGDKPYVTGTPGAAPSALSVAQTAVPSSTGFAMQLTAPASVAGLYEAVFQSWSKPLTSAVTSVVQYGDGAGGNLDGCAPFAAGTLTGKVVLVDRGTCNFSAKIANIAAGNAAIGIIGLITPGDPFDGSLGLCPDNLCAAIPGYMVSQATANRMKVAGATAVFDPKNGIPLVGTVVGSSSRGPSNVLNLVKPEIGAPGASVSAVAGSGTGTAPFGGTSGAAPMVTGSAALLASAFPARGPLEIKAVLINTGETNIQNGATLFGATIAPITRIGGGEVRVDRAYASPAAAWIDADATAVLGFGFQDVNGSTTLTKTVHVRNYSASAKTFAISKTFRFANDEANGAVRVTPSASSITVPAKGDASFTVTMGIDGSKLRTWSLNAGSAGASGSTLTTVEYDGYVWLNDTSTTADDASPLHLPWQVLPRKAAAVTASSTTLPVSGSVNLVNGGQAGSLETYSLVATSPDDPGSPAPGDNVSDADFKGVGVATFGVPADFCGDAASWVYAIDVNTWERQVTPQAPILFEFDFDLDRDGTNDYAVYNRDLGGLSSLNDGRNAAFVLNIATGEESAFFLTDQATNSGNTVLYFCADQMGLGMADAGRLVDVTGFAVDFYTSGTVRDTVAFPAVFGGERYVGFVNGTPGGDSIAAGATVPLEVYDFGAAGTNPTESGLIVRTLHGTAATESIQVTVTP